MSGRLKARMRRAVLSRRELVGSDDLAIFRFEPDVPVFPFRAGQFAHLGLDVGDEFLTRIYSIASSPYDRTHLEFYIVRMPEGRFTPHLFRLQEGDEVRYMGPGGKFVLDRARGTRLLMMSTGTGLAPFVSMVRKLHADHLRGERAFRTVTVLQGVSHTRDLGYHEEFTRLAADPSFGLLYVATISRPDEDAAYRPTLCRGRVNDLVRYLLGEERTGRVEVALGEGMDRAELLERIPPAETSVLLCGNPGMIRDAEAVVRRHGYHDILKEDYW